MAADQLGNTTNSVAQSASMQNEAVANVSEDMVRLTELVSAMDGIHQCYGEIAGFVEKQHKGVWNSDIDNIMIPCAFIFLKYYLDKHVYR